MNRTTLAAIAAAILLAAIVDVMFLRIGLIAAVIVWYGVNVRSYSRRPDFVEACRMVDAAYATMSDDERRLVNAYNNASEAQRAALVGACERIGRQSDEQN